MLVNRKNIEGTIVRAPGMLYQDRGLDSISNLYVIKIVNKTSHDIPLKLRLEEMPGSIAPIQGEIINVKKEAQAQASFFIILPKQTIKHRKTMVKIGLYESGKPIDVLSTNFMGPFSTF